MKFSDLNIVWVVICAIATIAGTSIAIDTRYAKSNEVTKLAINLESYKLEQQKDTVQQRIWDTEDRLEKVKQPEAKQQLQERLRDLNNQKEDIKQKLDDLKKEEKK